MPLQKPFRGISDVLGLYRGGNVQFEQDPQVKLTLAAEKWLMDPVWQFQSESDVHLVGHRAVVNIPQDEVWLLWSLSGLSTIPLTAGNSIGTMAVYQQLGVAGNEMPLSDPQNSSFTIAAVGSYASFNAKTQGGLWCMDGSIGYIVTARSGATNTQIDWGFQVSKFKR